jgi:NADP-dependent 3-hydroxy acid dehydrogenase YdfG
MSPTSVRRKRAVSAALARFGQIDVLVNNAGRALLGAVEEASAEEVRSVFAVNVDGLLNVMRAVLPSMRERRSGRILNLSSVGGFGAWPGWGVYCATKFAVEGAQRSALRRASVAARLGMNRTTLQARLKDWPSLVPNKVDISTSAD